jgi:hypothetical protein
MKAITTFAAMALAIALSGCGGGDQGGVTPEESAGLNNAAEMLDASPDSLVAGEETPLGNGEVAVPGGEQEAAAGNDTVPPE